MIEDKETARVSNDGGARNIHEVYLPNVLRGQRARRENQSLVTPSRHERRDVRASNFALGVGQAIGGSVMVTTRVTVAGAI